MPVRIRNRVFAPRLFATLLSMLVLALFLSLGFWQLRRADEKRELLAAFATGQASVAEFNAANAAKLPRYQRVTAAGRYDPDRQLLLDNMPSKSGAAGYRVLTPFLLDDGGLVLVDRGWVPLGADRNILPLIDVDSSQRRIAAMLDELPRPGMRLGAPDDASGSWPRVVNFPEHGELAAVYGEQLVRPILLLDATADSGFERAWEARFGFGPERHIGYAIQWFALASALLVIYFLVNLKASASNLE